MNTTAKQKSADVTQKLRDVADTGAERSKEAFETVGAASTEAAELIKNCYSTALQGMQDYNSKVMEFAQANTKSYVEFVQKLAGVKSPLEFIEISNEHARSRLTALAEQAKQLTTLAQQVTLSSTEPLKTAFGKAPLAPR